MNKIFMINLVLIAFNAAVIKPTFANTDVSQTIYKIPVSAASIAAGTVIGTPIAIVRKTASQYTGCVKEFKKDSNTYKFWGACYSVPVAVVSGLIKGTVYGTKNAIHYSIDKPFGKNAFSLGDLEDNVPPSQPIQTKTRSNMDRPESQPWGTPR